MRQPGKLCYPDWTHSPSKRAVESDSPASPRLPVLLVNGVDLTVHEVHGSSIFVAVNQGAPNPITIGAPRPPLAGPVTVAVAVDLVSQAPLDADVLLGIAHADDTGWASSRLRNRYGVISIATEGVRMQIIWRTTTPNQTKAYRYCELTHLRPSPN
jgi:hypothetical protein